jgi:hypothetical protein
MATVKGPLMSMTAQGQLGSNLIFQNQNGRSVVKNFAKPKNPNSYEQKRQRCFMAFLSQSWKLLSTAQRATWLSLVRDESIPVYNAYLTFNMHRFSLNQGPTAIYPVQDISPTAVSFAGSGVIVGNSIKGTLTRTWPSDTWGGIVFAQDWHATGLTIDHVGKTQWLKNKTSLRFSIDDLPDGDYELALMTFSTTGKMLYYSRNSILVIRS